MIIPPPPTQNSDKVRKGGISAAEKLLDKTMPNGIDGIDRGIENGIDGTDDGIEKNAEKILNAILADPKITQKNLARETGLSIRTIARELKKLRETGVIRRVGSARFGSWEIVKSTQ